MVAPEELKHEHYGKGRKFTLREKFRLEESRDT